jgi:hypothetical protein
MSALWLLGDILPFLLGIILAGFLYKRVRHKAVMPILAIAAVVAFNWLIIRLRFTNVGREFLLGLVGAGAITLVITCIALFDRPRRDGWRVAYILFGPLVVMIMFPWTSRLNNARMVAWSCDGKIVAKYRSNNHQAPTLAVSGPNGETKLEGVDQPLWDNANVGDRFAKPRGSVFGHLRGATTRVVRSLAIGRDQQGSR